MAKESYRQELFFNIPSRRGFVNFTSQVEEAMRESKFSEGLQEMGRDKPRTYEFIDGQIY
jgi:thiamine phosphate synthase YjbQ (UPF0047 family)